MAVAQLPHPRPLVGTRVVVADLLSAGGSALNGCEGEVQAFDAQKGRYLVFMDCGDPVLLQDANLKPAVAHNVAQVPRRASTTLLLSANEEGTTT